MAGHTHCGHGHEHHDHAHPLKDQAVITHHEGSIICAYETAVKLPLSKIRLQMETLLEKVQDFVNSSGGIVGHIKAYLEERGEGIFLSAAGGTIQSQQIEEKNVQIYFAAIVFACDENMLSREVEALFAQLKKSE